MSHHVSHVLGLFFVCFFSKKTTKRQQQEQQQKKDEPTTTKKKLLHRRHEIQGHVSPPVYTIILKRENKRRILHVAISSVRGQGSKRTDLEAQRGFLGRDWTFNKCRIGIVPDVTVF